jgi:hypothetical protein
MEQRNNFEQAARRAAERQKSTPHAVAARFDKRLGKVIVELSSGLMIGFRPEDAQGLERARVDDLTKIEITPSGFGLHFPKLDADLYLPALLEGFFGSSKWAAARLGASGGSVRTKVKAAAARANGRLGGRPRKPAHG